MSIRARLLLLILFATLTPVIVVGVNFLEYRKSEIADARHDTGELKFVQLASLNLEKYTQSRSTNLPFESAVLALMDGKKTMLAWHPGGEKLRGTSFADSPLHRLARGREGDNAPEGIDARANAYIVKSSFDQSNQLEVIRRLI